MKTFAHPSLFGGLVLAVTLAGCGSSPTPPTPLATPIPVPTPTPPTGSFALIATAPSPGGVILVPDTLAHSGPDLTFDFVFSADIPKMHWEIDLYQGDRNCLATQSAYATRLDGGPTSGFFAEYKAGSTARFESSFWVLQGCGTSFVSDRLLFTVIDSDGRQLFQQAVSQGWTFHP